MNSAEVAADLSSNSSPVAAPATPLVFQNVMREAAERPADGQVGWDNNWDNGVDHSHSS